MAETTRTFEQDVGAGCSNSCVPRYLSTISRVAQSSAVPFRERSSVRAVKMRSTRSTPYLVIPPRRLCLPLVSKQNLLASLHHNGNKTENVLYYYTTLLCLLTLKEYRNSNKRINQIELGNSKHLTILLLIPIMKIPDRRCGRCEQHINQFNSAAFTNFVSWTSH